MPLPSTGPLKGTVAVNALRSQGLLVTLAMAGVASLTLGAGLLYARIPEGGWLLLIGAACFPMSMLGWWKSQADTDMDDGKPTTVTWPDGKSISVDPRVLNNSRAVAGLGLLLEHFQRAPLSAADGVVDAKFKVVPGSTAAADEITARVNAEASQYLDTVVQGARSAMFGGAGAQDNPAVGVTPDLGTAHDFNGAQISPEPAAKA